MKLGEEAASTLSDAALTPLRFQIPQAPSPELSCGDGHGAMPGEAQRCRRGSTPATARLNGGVAEGAKGHLGGRGAHDREEGGTYLG
jgi:hypothetical protein